MTPKATQEELLAATNATLRAHATSDQTKAMINAVYAPLTGTPITDQGRAVVARLHEAIERYEFQRVQAPRKNKRKGTAKQFDKAIGAFLADLLLAQAHKKACGWIWRSLRDESFDNGPVTRTQAKSVVEGLVALGFTRHVKGYPEFSAFGPIRRFVSPKMCATPALLRLCAECGIEPADADEHFTIGPPKNPVIVRGAAAYDEDDRKIKGKVLKKLDVPEKLVSEVREINDFLEGVTLADGRHRWFFRGYNNGNVQGFAFDRGGRLYSAGEKSYQSLKGEERLMMKINGEQVAEVDIRASYLTILYAFHQQNFDSKHDPYLIPALGAEARDVVKMFVTATIGNGAPLHSWSNRQAKDYKQKTGQSLRRTWPIETIAKPVLAQHPILTRLQRRIKGRVRDWSDLMWVESQAIVGTMLDLQRTDGIPSYPVHDSLIVPRSKAERAILLLRMNYYGELRDYFVEATHPFIRVSL